MSLLQLRGVTGGYGPVSVQTVEEILRSGNPFLAACLTNGTDVFNVAHLGRAPTALQMTALEARGRRCANKRCSATIGLERDHTIDWHKTLRTIVKDLDWLCPLCHKKKTHHGWKLEPGTGPRRFLSPEEQRELTLPGAGAPSG